MVADGCSLWSWGRHGGRQGRLVAGTRDWLVILRSRSGSLAWIESCVNWASSKTFLQKPTVSREPLHSSGLTTFLNCYQLGDKLFNWAFRGFFGGELQYPFSVAIIAYDRMTVIKSSLFYTDLDSRPTVKDQNFDRALMLHHRLIEVKRWECKQTQGRIKLILKNRFIFMIKGLFQQSWHLSIPNVMALMT